MAVKKRDRNCPFFFHGRISLVTLDFGHLSVLLVSMVKKYYANPTYNTLHYVCLTIGGFQPQGILESVTCVFCHAFLKSNYIMKMFNRHITVLSKETDVNYYLH